MSAPIDISGWYSAFYQAESPSGNVDANPDCFTSPSAGTCAPYCTPGNPGTSQGGLCLDSVQHMTQVLMGLFSPDPISSALGNSDVGTVATYLYGSAAANNPTVDFGAFFNAITPKLMSLLNIPFSAPAYNAGATTQNYIPNQQGSIVAGYIPGSNLGPSDTDYTGGMVVQPAGPLMNNPPAGSSVVTGTPGASIAPVAGSDIVIGGVDLTQAASGIPVWGWAIAAGVLLLLLMPKGR